MIEKEPKKLLKRNIRFSQEQYDLLKRCSARKNLTEWNEWRNNNPEERILLEKADLDKAWLMRAELKGACLQNAKLRGAMLWEAKLQRANLRETFLQGAKFKRAYIQVAEFGRAKLQEADFSRAIVDGETLIYDCEIDKKTKFDGVGLGNMRIYPNVKQLLEYNIRRMNWEKWYKENPKLKWLVQPYWIISDYGKSTGRIVSTFFALAFVFAAIYYVCALVNPLGIVSSLSVGKEGPVPPWLVPLRSIYFSVVTMTTLGFGDMHTNCQSFWGHLLLTVQVILGYVLLGALVTRFAILFTAGEPAGSFTPMDKEPAFPR